VALAWNGDAVSTGLENQQFTLGEGPGLDASASGVPVLVPSDRHGHQTDGRHRAAALEDQRIVNILI
jgi:hypothetical protein